MAYAALLDRVLEDRHVDDSETGALIEMAIKWGLSFEQINFAHRQYFNHLVMAALDDGVITEAERRDLKVVARLLGQEKLDIDQVLKDATAKMARSAADKSPAPTPPASLTGKLVCFTGELRSRYKG